MVLKKKHVNVILPILDFTDKDVENFIKIRGIILHPLYYNEDGSLNVQKRLGCIGCPLKHDNGLGDFKAHPKLVRAWLRAGQKWWNSHPNIKSRKKFSDIYELFVSIIFFKSYEKSMLSIKGGIFNDPIDCRKWLEDYFKIKLD